MDKGAEKKRFRLSRRAAGNLFIVAGALCVLYFLWINYSGAMIRGIYSWVYDRYLEGDVDPSEEFFTLDDLPSFLFIGQDLLGDHGSPQVEDQGPPAQEPAPEEPEPQPEPEPEPVTKKKNEQDENIAPVTIDYSDRQSYNTNDMMIRAPRLGLKSGVVDGTDERSLKKGPGLYLKSDLPGQGDVNVLIAAHRDVYGAWFYNIDKMKPGDKVSLLFGPHVYVYACDEVRVIEKNDWSVTERRGVSSLTLTSCHPKGTSEKRIVAICTLAEVQDR